MAVLEGIENCTLYFRSRTPEHDNMGYSRNAGGMCSQIATLRLQVVQFACEAASHKAPSRRAVRAATTATKSAADVGLAKCV